MIRKTPVATISTLILFFNSFVLVPYHALLPINPLVYQD